MWTFLKMIRLLIGNLKLNELLFILHTGFLSNKLKVNNNPERFSQMYLLLTISILQYNTLTHFDPLCSLRTRINYYHASFSSSSNTFSWFEQIIHLASKYHFFSCSDPIFLKKQLAIGMFDFTLWSIPIDYRILLLLVNTYLHEGN